MRIIDLDATHWKTWEDFYAALLAALGAPDWHGDSVNALVDSMIWGEINKIDPPYRIVVRNVRNLPKDAVKEIYLAQKALAQGRADFQARKGYDIMVEFDVVE